MDAPALEQPHAPVSDPEDRLDTVGLDPAAETISRATALYAEALRNDADRNPKMALAQLQEVVSLDPHFDDAQVRLANLLLQSGQADTALVQLQDAQAKNPQSAAIEATLGYAQRLRDQPKEALRLCTDALTRDPTQAIAMRVLLEIAADQNQLEKAVAHISDILKDHRPVVTAAVWLNLAHHYGEVSRGSIPAPSGDTMLRTLLPVYIAASEVNPPSIETFNLLADTYRQLGRQQEALDTLHQALDLEPSNLDLLLHAAELENELGLKDAALHDDEEVYALNPRLLGLRTTIVRLDIDTAHYEKAIPLVQAALAETPDDPGLLIWLGIAQEGAHQHAESTATFQKIFASATCPVDAYLRLAVFQLSEKQTLAARQTLLAAHNRFPKSAEVRFYEAIQCRYARHYEAALEFLNEMQTLATASDGNLFDVNYFLESALIMNFAHRKDLIEPTLRQGLAKYPDNANLMNELAYVWADEGRHLPEALAYGHRAAALDPENGAIQDTCGWIYFRMGQPKEALPYLQRAATLTNNDPVVLEHLGDVLQASGNRGEAVAAWRHALQKDPGNPDLLHRIDAPPAQATHAQLRAAPLK